jgi:hypothetical protein
MSQYYRILNCPNYQEINHDLIDYVHKYTTLITKSDNYQYCNFLDKFNQDITHFVKSNPKLVAWFTSMNITLKDMYFTLAWTTTSPVSSETSCPIHIDKPPVVWKLNWPILNMERTSVRFYLQKNPQIDINTLVRRSGDPDSKDNDNYQFDYKDFYEVERHDFAKNEPIIMNGQVAHDVGFYENPVFPRIGLQGMFFKEPIHLL